MMCYQVTYFVVSVEMLLRQRIFNHKFYCFHLAINEFSELNVMISRTARYTTKYICVSLHHYIKSEN